jgi:hypothetical protein
MLGRWEAERRIFRVSVTAVPSVMPERFSGAPLVTGAASTRAPQKDLEISAAETGPTISADALRLAVRLLAARERGRRLLLFGGTTDRSALPLVYETAQAMLQLNERPLVVVDLDEQSDDAVDDRRDHVPDGWPIIGLDQLRESVTPDLVGAIDVPAPICVARGGAEGQSGLAFLASPEFAAVLAAMRTRLAAVLCHATPIANAVRGLLVARQCDGVVLTVPEAGATLTQIRAATGELTRVQATVLGFVMERDSGGRGWMRRRK